MIGGHAMSDYDTVADNIRTHRDQALAAADRAGREGRPRAARGRRPAGRAARHAVTEAGSGALMLVVGSRGVGAFAAMILGSVSRYAATHAACPVVVVREEIGAAHRQIGVGVGDLEHSRALLDYAFEEAVLRNASVVALHSWHTPQFDISRAGQAPAGPAADVSKRRPPGSSRDSWTAGVRSSLASRSARTWCTVTPAGPWPGCRPAPTWSCWAGIRLTTVPVRSSTRC